MRIVHVITRLIVGGAQENTVATVLGLRRRGDVEVRLFSGPTSGPEGSLESMVREVPGLLTVVPPLVRSVHPWKDAVAYVQLRRLLAHDRPDIVHTHSGKAGVLGRLAAHRAGVRRIVHTIHGPSFGDFQSPLANFIFRQAEREAARVTTRFVSVAQAMTDQYLAAGIGHPGQYSRVFSGFALEPFLNARNDSRVRARLGLRPDDIVVGKIARFFKLKGHEDLFAVARDLVQECPRIRFLLVGDGIWRRRFEETARSLGIGEHFVFTGLVAPEAVPELVGVMDMLVHLSRREGLPRALPQAMAAGRPVVAFACDGAGEVCLDGVTGFLIPPRDRSGLASAIVRLAEDAELRVRFGQQGREFVQARFSEETMVERLHDLYRSLLRNQT